MAASPESSLSWCLAHISRPGSGAEHHGNNRADTNKGKELDKRSRISQWRALVAIRTQHIKGDKAGIARFRTQGGLEPLLDLLKQPECSKKTLDLALSILANCCTESQTCMEVRKLDGISIVVGILKRNVALDSVQNRAARALGNLAMDSQNSALIHSAGGVPLLLLCVSVSSTSSSPTTVPSKDTCPKLECAQSAARALLYLSDTPSNRLSLLTQGTLSALAPLIAPEYPQGLRRAALRTLHELTRGCGVECAREVSRSGVLAQLGVMASGESGKSYEEELALKTLANICSQGCLRPLVGSLGVIQKFTEEVRKDLQKSGVFLKALCMCCKEAVNRAKVKESGGLEVLTSFLSTQQGHPLSRLVILACVDFVFDESAMEQLQELGLVPLLVARLVDLTKGEQSTEKMDTSPLNMSPTELLPPSCYESFDFPPPEGHKKEDAVREQGLCSSSFQSLRSWLVSEGLISSEGDLLDSSCVDGECESPQLLQSSSPNPYLNALKSPSSSTNTPVSTCKKTAQPFPDPPTLSPQSPGSITSQINHSSSAASSPTETPVTASKFSSPQRRRQRTHSTTSLSKVTLETPPSVSRQITYHHPYHPEPWTTESPILLLLSRFSHASDPSAALVTSGTMSGLLYYLTQHQDPSSRCFRMLSRLSCNPNCLQALVRTGTVALIQHRLCQRAGWPKGEERQTDGVRAKVKQLGVSLLNNLRVQCESGFGSGVLTRVMMSGSELDKLNCALSLPLISNNKALLKKLLLDGGGLLLALQPLTYCSEELDVGGGSPAGCGRLLSDLLNSPHAGQSSEVPSLYFSLLIGCLSTLTCSFKTELQPKHAGAVVTGTVSQTDKTLPPPSKRPRLADRCPYDLSNYDLLLLLDDGTRVPANREAVAGEEASDRIGSEYFRALLRGGFGEAQCKSEDGIPIRDVSQGMLIPVLHYLHGCRVSTDRESTGRHDQGKTGASCQILDSLVLEGLSTCGKDAEEDLRDNFTFEKSPVAQVMIGACRFLVTELKQELEDLCVSLVLSSLTRAANKPAASEKETADKAAPKTDPECLQSAEEDLANRTSELELTGFEMHTDNSLGPKPNSPPQQTHKTDKNCPVKHATPVPKVRRVSFVDKSVTSNGTRLKPKNLVKGSPRPLKSTAQDDHFTSGGGAARGALAALLPQLYWFSQRYSYPTLGRTCLSLLLGCRDCPQPFPSSIVGDCFRRLATEADCVEVLKQDLVNLVTTALG